jgi:mono/diheme cytochrome c family protein
MTTLTTKTVLTVAVAFFFAATIASCEDSSNKTSENQTLNEHEKKMEEKVAEVKQYNTGIGAITKVEIGAFDAALAKKGKGVYEMKCQSCHRIEGDRLVGPSFTGVTERRTPEWVMNMIMNTEAMLNEDQAAKDLLEVCLVRMPNQNVAEPDARSIVEYFREIDNHKKSWTE